jgi:hypothetical protein
MLSARGDLALHSVACTIDEIAPRLSPALFTREAHARLARVAEALPAALTSWVYFECRLRRDEPRVDLIVRVDQRGRDILAGENPVIRLAPSLQGDPVWRSVRGLARAWSDPSSPLFRGVERLWLEFDVHASCDSLQLGELPAPGIFVELAREVYAQHRRDDRLAAAMAALRPLAGKALPPALVRNLRRCWELLPSGAVIPYMGVFPARGSGAIRISVAGLSDANLHAYLRALRWPGSQRELADAISAFLPPARAPQPRLAIVNIDVSEEVGAGVGMEYLLSHAAQLRGSILEGELLERLVRIGLCSPAKCDALCGWPSMSLRTMPHELWPSRVCRRVNHLKLSYGAHAPLEVKAYLAASHEYRPAHDRTDGAAIRLQRSTG